MSKEIRTQVDALEQGTKEQEDILKETENYIQFWRTHFGVDDIGNKYWQGQEEIGAKGLQQSTFYSPPPPPLPPRSWYTDVPETPHGEEKAATFHSNGTFRHIPVQHMNNRIMKQQEKIDELGLALNAARHELSCLRKRGMTEVNEYVEVFREGAEADRAAHREILSEVKQQCEERVALVQMEAKIAKEQAEKEIQSVRQQAEENLAHVVSILEQEKDELEMENDEIQKKVTRDYFYRRGQLDDKIKNVEEHERRAVQRASKRLKRLHAIELSAARREAVLREMKGCLNDELDMDKLGLIDTCSDETNGGQNNGDDDEVGFNIRYRAKEDECIWSRSRIDDLERWVKTLTAALREANKLNGNTINTAFPVTTKAQTNGKKYKAKPSKPVDESR